MYGCYQIFGYFCAPKSVDFSTLLAKILNLVTTHQKNTIPGVFGVKTTESGISLIPLPLVFEIKAIIGFSLNSMDAGGCLVKNIYVLSIKSYNSYFFTIVETKSFILSYLTLRYHYSVQRYSSFNLWPLKNNVVFRHIFDLHDLKYQKCDFILFVNLLNHQGESLS